MLHSPLWNLTNKNIGEKKKERERERKKERKHNYYNKDHAAAKILKGNTINATKSEYFSEYNILE